MYVDNLLDSLGPISPDAYTHWVAAALTEAAALRVHDDLVFPSTRDRAQLDTSDRLREAWSQWADNAERLWGRIQRAGLNDRSVPGLADLIRAIGRSRAMLKMSPEEMLRRQEQMEQGKVMTIEEVRRELRLTNRS